MNSKFKPQTAKINRGIAWMLMAVMFMMAMPAFLAEQYGLFALYCWASGTMINLIRDQKKLLAERQQ